MNKNFLQLRDQGCQGAWEIFLRAREMRLAETDASAASGALGAVAPRLALHFTPDEQHQLTGWQEVARRLGGAAVTLEGAPGMSGGFAASALFSEVACANVDMLVVGGLETDALNELARIVPRPVINAGNELARPCRVLADLLTVALRLGPAANKLDAVRIGWVGGADGENAGLARSWLDAVLCFRHEFFMAFPQGREPDAEHLDFAMNAGAKIFLSYDPLPATDGCHALVATPWIGAGRTGGLTPRHPLASDAELARVTEGVPVFPLVSGLPDALQADREANLLACQTALVEFMAARADA